MKNSCLEQCLTATSKIKFYALTRDSRTCKALEISTPRRFEHFTVVGVEQNTSKATWCKHVKKHPTGAMLNGSTEHKTHSSKELPLHNTCRLKFKTDACVCYTFQRQHIWLGMCPASLRVRGKPLWMKYLHVPRSHSLFALS